MSGAGKDILIGIDAGTSVVKAIAFDLDGRQIAGASAPNRYRTRPDGAAVQSMDDVWEDCATTLRELAEKTPGLKDRIAAVGVTAQGDGTWLVGPGNRPVAEAWLWLDGRAGPTVRKLRAQASDRARFLTTGTGLNASQQGSQLAHMLATAPEAVVAAETALHCKDWLYLNLTGIRATDPSEACFTFGNFRTGAYDGTVIDALGLMGQRRLLPDIVDGRKQWHALTPAAARATGLLAGTPIVLGSVDVICTALGAGIRTGGEAARCTIIGSTGMHMRACPVDEVYLNAESTGYSMVLPIDGLIAQMQSNMAATLNIDWALSLAADLMAEFGHPVSRSELVQRIEPWVEASKPGAVLFHPYISEAGERGPFVNGNARASFGNLSSSHRFPELMRGILEGLSLAARDCYGAMGESTAVVCLSGGASRSRALRSILAATLNAPVRTASLAEAGAAGAAMIAGVSVGAQKDMDAAIAQWVAPTLGPVEQPDPKLVPIYDKVYEAYLHTRGALEPVWETMAAAQD